MQMESGSLDIDVKLLSDCLMSLAVFEAWQEPLYVHLVTLASTLPLTAFGPRSLRQTYQASPLSSSSLRCQNQESITVMPVSGQRWTKQGNMYALMAVLCSSACSDQQENLACRQEPAWK